MFICGVDVQSNLASLQDLCDQFDFPSSINFKQLQKEINGSFLDDTESNVCVNVCDQAKLDIQLELSQP